MNSFAELDRYLNDGRTARSRERRKLANNTYAERRPNGSIAIRLHATDVVTYRPNGEIMLDTGGWFTVTTKDRINTYSPLSIWSERGVWTIGNVTRDGSSRPDWPRRTVIKPFVAEDPGPEPTDDGIGCIADTDHESEQDAERYVMRESASERPMYAVTDPEIVSDDGGPMVRVRYRERVITRYGRHSWGERPITGIGARGEYAQCAHCKGLQSRRHAWQQRMNGGYGARDYGYRQYREAMNRYGSVEAWEAAYKADGRDTRAEQKEWRAWEATNVIEFFDGITFKEGRSGLRAVNLPSPAKQAGKAKKRDALKRRINLYVDAFVAEMAEQGIPAPSGGDCWFCSMFEQAGIGDTEHLLSHIKESYFVPSLLINALAEAGYRHPGIIAGFDPDSERMGGSHMMADACRRALERYLKKRLITDAQPVARIHAPSH